jgi:hypothetical protein
MILVSLPECSFQKLRLVRHWIFVPLLHIPELPPLFFHVGTTLMIFLSQVQDFTLAAHNIIAAMPKVHPTYIPRNASEEQSLASSIQVLRTCDARTFLASRIPNLQVPNLFVPDRTTKLALQILPTSQIPVSRLLNHPNIISLVDIVQPSAQEGCPKKEKGKFGDITVWEDMTAGSLSYILPSSDNYPAFEDTNRWHTLASQNFGRFSLPEGLCWHVLRSISRALLWLHHGVKETEAIPGDWQRHDDDWQAVLIMDVSPGQIWFKHPKGDETYGECKLGGFSYAKVCGSPGAGSANAKRVDEMPLNKQYFWAPVCISSHLFIYHLNYDLPQLPTSNRRNTI